ncbi:MAG: DNA polymerase III subunit delta [Spirochaetales bacterium]|nr:DNA polymerase III subunit delta [Spirochaetales bacterium]MCF7938261.1 DNA polymerase III subunit delta [Spirochaetales bacterium]
MAKLLPAYLLLGPETGKKEAFVSDLLSSFSGEPEISRYYAFETPPEEVVSQLQNGSLFASERLVRYRAVDTLSGSQEVLKNYLTSPAEGAVLIMESDQTSVKSSISSLIPKAGTKIFWELFDNQKSDVVIGFFRRHDYRIDSEAVRFLLEMVPGDTNALEEACARLTDLFPPDKPIEREDLEPYLYHNREENPFTLTNRVLEKDLGRSLEVMHVVLERGDQNPIALLGILSRQLRRHLQYLRLRKEEHLSAEEAAGRLKLRGKLARKQFEATTRRWSVVELEQALVLASEFDARMKESGSGLQPLLAELYLYYLIERGGRLPEAYRTMPQHVLNH